MKTRLILRREGGHLIAAEPWTAEKIDWLPADKDITADVSTLRNLGQNNVYWAGLAYAVHNIEAIERRWSTAKALHKSLLVRLGYYTEVPFIQIKRSKVTAAMVEAGRAAGMYWGALPDEAIVAIYRAMQAAAPDYGVHIVEDSTRFDAMIGADFTIYFDRAKLTILEMTGRDPWAEWLEEKKQQDEQRRRGYGR